MCALGDIGIAVEFVRKMRGGSQPILVRANDGLLYVVKFVRNLQGPNLLFNEVIGTELYRTFGLPVPKWRPILVTDLFLDRNSSCWFQTESGPIRPAAGLCFGSRFLGGTGEAVWEILPGCYFDRVSNRRVFGLAWLLDVCAEHSDNRQAIYLHTPGGNLHAVFIDHGSMFGGPCACDQPHPIASRYLDPRVYTEQRVGEFRRGSDMLNSRSLWNLLRALPSDWYSASALERFSACVSRLADPESLRQVRESIADLCQRTCTRDRIDGQRDNTLALAVLCAGIRRAGTRRKAVV